MNFYSRFYLFCITVICVLTGCSSTTLSGSWRSPEHIGKVEKVYIVGVSRQETSRRTFEDEFGRALKAHGIETVSSYRDFKDTAEDDLELLMQKVKTNGADALLLTRILSKRTEEVVTPGRVTGYSAAPNYFTRGSYYPQSHYLNYRDYYDRRFEMTYEPATISKFDIITLESNLYDVSSGDLIWSAQLETVKEGTVQSMIEDFIKIVVKDLVTQGMI